MSTATLPRATFSVERLAQLAEDRTNVHEATSGRDAVMEVKLDGWRVLAHVAENGARLYTRKGKRLDNNTAHIRAALEQLLPVGSWVDGEAIVLGGNSNDVTTILNANDGHPDAEQVGYAVFDLLAHGELDVRSLALWQRRSALDSIFEDRNGYLEGQIDPHHVHLIRQHAATQENHDSFVRGGYEGSMVKLLDSRYASNKRGYGWFKIKQRDTVDAFVIGYKEGEGGNTGLIGSMTLAQYDADGNAVEIASCGTGFSMQERRAISEARDDYLSRVVEFEYTERFKNGKYRHPRFLRFREDKVAEDCLLDA